VLVRNLRIALIGSYPGVAFAVRDDQDMLVEVGGSSQLLFRLLNGQPKRRATFWTMEITGPIRERSSIRRGECRQGNALVYLAAHKINQAGLDVDVLVLAEGHQLPDY